MDPQSIQAAAALAETMIGLDRKDRAAELAERVLAVESGHPVANLALGMVRMTEGRFAEAKAALQRSVDTSPSAKAHYQLSLALARLGEKEASKKHIELYQQALQASQAELLELRGMPSKPDKDKLGADEPK